VSRSFSSDPGYVVDSSERENDGGLPPPRINQLDALALDQEMLSTFHNYLADTFKFFLKNPLDYVGPEVEALLRLVIWHATHWAKGTSVGQEALGISFLSPSPRQMVGLALIQIGLRYLDQRQTLVSAAFAAIPAAPDLTLFFRWAGHAVSCVQLVNSLLFLCHGRHSSVASRLLGLMPVSNSNQPRTVAYSYMSRELLWHSFTELLIFLLPIISASKLKSKIRTQFSSLLPSKMRKASPPTSAKCAACAYPPVLPCLPSCGHTLCYYCLSANLQSQATMACPSCEETISEDTISFLT